MNKKTILGISFAAAAVAMLFGAAPLVDAVKPGYPGLASTQQAQNDHDNYNYRIEAKGPIPTDGSAGAFGYGIITGVDGDGNPENVLAITTHLCASDSFVQRAAPVGQCASTIGLLESAFGQPAGTDEANNDETFHAHILDLKPNDAGCDGVENNIGLEVDLGRTVSSGNNVSPDYPVNVIGNKITVLDVPVGGDPGFNGTASDEILAAVSFGIHPLNSGPTITNLCLTS
jgi:hypothetical protein